MKKLIFILPLLYYSCTDDIISDIDSILTENAEQDAQIDSLMTVLTQQQAYIDSLNNAQNIADSLNNLTMQSYIDSLINEGELTDSLLQVYTDSLNTVQNTLNTDQQAYIDSLNGVQQTLIDALINIENNDSFIFDDNYSINIIEGTTSLFFKLEFLKDLSNDFDGIFPNVDFASINIDKNQNGNVDAYLDVSYASITYQTICSQYIITDSTSTVCGAFVTEASLTSIFVPSELESYMHPIIYYNLPKSEVYTNGSIHFVIKIYSALYGYTTFPKSNDYPYNGRKSFNEVLIYP